MRCQRGVPTGRYGLRCCLLLNEILMKRSFLRQSLALMMVAGSLLAGQFAYAEDEAPDALIKSISVEVLDSVKADKSVRSGDLAKVIALVDTRVMPHVNFQRMTASAVGPAWRQATPEQQKRLQEEFKVLLVRSYAGALGQVTDQVIVIKPLRSAPEDKEVLVRTEIKGKGDAIQLDYRLEKTPGQGAGWKIYNINVLGVWLVETYKTQFAQEINSKGLDGLIMTLSDRNKANAKKA